MSMLYTLVYSTEQSNSKDKITWMWKLSMSSINNDRLNAIRYVEKIQIKRFDQLGVCIGSMYILFFQIQSRSVYKSFISLILVRTNSKTTIQHRILHWSFFCFIYVRFSHPIPYECLQYYHRHQINPDLSSSFPGYLHPLLTGIILLYIASRIRHHLFWTIQLWSQGRKSQPPQLSEPRKVGSTPVAGD